MTNTTSRRQELQSLVASMNLGRHKRIHFHDRCAVLAAVMDSFPQKLVAKAFGLSIPTVSVIANCETNYRYPKIAHELERLGKNAFIEKYLTEDILIKLRRVEHERTCFGRSRAE